MATLPDSIAKTPVAAPPPGVLPASGSVQGGGPGPAKSDQYVSDTAEQFRREEDKKTVQKFFSEQGPDAPLSGDAKTVSSRLDPQTVEALRRSVVAEKYPTYGQSDAIKQIKPSGDLPPAAPKPYDIPGLATKVDAISGVQPLPTELPGQGGGQSRSAVIQPPAPHTEPTPEPSGEYPIGPGTTRNSGGPLEATAGAEPSKTPTDIKTAKDKLTKAFIDMKPDNVAEAIVGLVSGVMDMIGSGLQAHAGVTSPTRLQKEFEMRLTSQQQANQMWAAAEAELMKLPMETEARIKVEKAIAEAKSTGDIATALGTLEPRLKEIAMQALVNAQNQTLGPGGIFSGGSIWENFKSQSGKAARPAP